MRRRILSIIILIVFVLSILSGCGEAVNTENITGTMVSQSGPYGEISVIIPEGWIFESYPPDSEEITSGLYGIRFYPEGENGYIEISSGDSFGVCGTGLNTETAIIAGEHAWLGTYDNNQHWDYISFEGEYEGLIVLSNCSDDWWAEYGEQVMNILDTLIFDKSKKEEGSYELDPGSEIGDIGLDFRLESITASGATLVFNQYDSTAPKGELSFGEEFEIEVLENGRWISLPVVVEGDYGFNSLANIIPLGDVLKKELDWGWLYGNLNPGEYRIKKTVNDFKEAEDYDSYTVYAYFIMN